MRTSDSGRQLRVNLDMNNSRYSAATLEKMESGLAPLRKVVQEFPISDLYISAFYHPRADLHHVKTSLVLTGRTLFTGEQDADLYTAFHRCIRKLVNKVQAYLDSLRNKDEMAKQQKGTHHKVLPTQDPNSALLNEAVGEGDYGRYRQAMLVYEEPLRKRLGRWIERYPELTDLLGTDLTMADLLEGVFLNSFERYSARPQAVPLGQWLEDLIDPSLKTVLRDPDGEMENIAFARTMYGLRPPQS